LLRGKTIILWPDSDEPGETYVANAATAIRAENPKADIRVVRPFPMAKHGEKGRDICDWVGNEADFAALVAGAVPFEQTDDAGTDAPEGQAVEVDVDREIARLAKLPRVEYERERKGAAERLGMRVAVLDKDVNAERPKGSVPGQGRDLVLTEPEPWQEPVDGAALLNEIEATIRKFVVCDKEAPAAVALWIAATWFSDVLEIAPILNVRSPEMRCGKSTLLNLIDKLSCRPLSVSNISSAALFRSIEKFSPTLILDEADAFLTDNEEARGVINSGHTRQNAFVLRTVGDEHEPKRFSTFGFKAIAGIGKRAATIEDRSIPISLKRKLPGEAVARLRHAAPGTFETLARKLARFAQDNKARVEVARPQMPEGLDDRQQDCWEPLYAIAQTAGDAWAKKAENAALHICNAPAEASFGVQLLSDILDIFGEMEELSSEKLTKDLLALSDRPWGECNRGKALTQNLLARWLKPFEIRPKNIGPKHERVKGYTVESFADAFKRYIPPISTVHPHTRNENNDLDENQTVHRKNGCTDANASNQLNSNDVYGCTD
jgi:putative DNA primase/helicase